MWLDDSRWLGPGGGLQGEEYEGVCLGYVNYEIPIKHMGQLAMLELREKLYAISYSLTLPRFHRKKFKY